MIDMQMGAHDDIDMLRGIAGSCKVRQEVGIEAIHLDAALLAVTKAGVDENPQGRRFYHQRVEAEAQLALRIDVVRLQPGNRQQGLRGGIRKNKVRPGDGGKFKLDDFSDTDFAHLPSHPASLA